MLEQNGSLTGFSIEFWDAIAKQMKVKTSCQLEPDVNGLQEAVQANTVDLSIVPVFVTSARDELFDFSYPIMQPCLQIVVRETGETRATVNPLGDTLRLMFSRTEDRCIGYCNYCIYDGKISSQTHYVMGWEILVLSNEDNERIALTHKGLKSGALEVGPYLSRPDQGRITEHALWHFHNLIETATRLEPMPRE